MAVLHIIPIIGGCQQFLSLADNGSDHGEELGDLLQVFFRVGHDAAYLSGLLEYGQQLGAEIQNVDVDFFRRVFVDQRVDHGLQECGLSCGDRTADSVVTVARKIHADRHLVLVVRVVSLSHDDRQGPLAVIRILKPVFHLEIPVSFYRCEGHGYGQNRHPQLQHMVVAVSSGHISQILVDRLQLRLGLGLRKLHSLSQGRIDDLVRLLIISSAACLAVQFNKVFQPGVVVLAPLVVDIFLFHEGVDRLHEFLSADVVHVFQAVRPAVTGGLHGLTYGSDPPVSGLLLIFNLKVVAHQINLSYGIQHLGYHQFFVSQNLVVDGS